MAIIVESPGSHRARKRNAPPTTHGYTDEDVRPDANVTHERFFDLLEKEIQKVHSFTDRKVSKRAGWGRGDGRAGGGGVGVGLIGGCVGRGRRRRGLSKIRPTD